MARRTVLWDARADWLIVAAKTRVHAKRWRSFRLDTVFRSPQMRKPYFRIVAMIRQFEMPRQDENQCNLLCGCCLRNRLQPTRFDFKFSDFVLLNFS